MNQDMDILVKRLAHTRQIYAEYKEQFAAIEADIQAEIERRFGSELERVKSLLNTAKLDLEDADNDVRRVALAAYGKDGNKKPHPAVTVKIFTVATYNTNDAIEYCAEHYRDALKLDKRAFEKAAKVLKPGCVTIGSEPRPTVASDLAQWA